MNVSRSNNVHTHLFADVVISRGAGQLELTCMENSKFASASSFTTWEDGRGGEGPGEGEARRREGPGGGRGGEEINHGIKDLLA